MGNDIQLCQSDIEIIDGEPRIRDIRVGERLGYAHPRHIRDLISRNENDLRQYGTIWRAARRNDHNTNGRRKRATIEEYYLNRGQLLRIVTLSNTAYATVATHEIISIFMAYQQGELIQATAPPVKELAPISSPVPAIVEGVNKDIRTIIGGIIKSVVRKQVAEMLCEHGVVTAAELHEIRDEIIAAIEGRKAKPHKEAQLSLDFLIQ